MLLLQALSFCHEMVHLSLYLSDLELEVAFLLFVTLDKLILHGIKLLLGTSQLLDQLLSHCLFTFQCCCHLIISLLKLSPLLAEILIDSFEFIDDG